VSIELGKAALLGPSSTVEPEKIVELLGLGVCVTALGRLEMVQEVQSRYDMPAGTAASDR
jgi:hypothetical protein